jgi:hypothetical protein
MICVPHCGDHGRPLTSAPRSSIQLSVSDSLKRSSEIKVTTILLISTSLHRLIHRLALCLPYCSSLRTCLSTKVKRALHCVMPTQPIDPVSDSRIQHKTAVLNGYTYHYLYAVPKSVQYSQTVFLVCFLSFDIEPPDILQLHGA